MFKSLVALTGLLVALASAQPSAPEGKCVNGTKTVTVTFDDKPAKGKDNFGGLQHHGWSIAAVPATCENCSKKNSIYRTFAGASKPHVIRGDPPAEMTMSQLQFKPFRFKSFDLACYYYVSDVFIRATKCSPLVTSANRYASDHAKVETIMLDYNNDDSKNPKFLSFEGPKQFADQLYFYLPGRPVGKYNVEPQTVINIDNVVMEQEC